MNEWRSVLGPAPGNIEVRLGLARPAAKAGDRPATALEYLRIVQIVPDPTSLTAGRALHKVAGDLGR